MFIENTPSNNSQELREKREALGLSFEDLFKRTRVRVVYLQAIENEEFHLLPVPVYTKNFIRIYARALGVDSEPIIKKYEVYLLESRKETRAPAPEDVLEKKHFFTKITGQKTYLSIAFVLTAVVIVAWLISKQYESSPDIINSSNSITNAVGENKEQNVKPSLNATAPAARQVESNPALPAQDKKNTQLPVKMQTASTSSVSANDVKPFKKQVSLPVENIVSNSSGDISLLVIKATEETWMRIKADQNPSFQVVLKPGEKIVRKAESFDIDIGNAGGVKVQFKGKDIETAGKTGDVIHLRLP
jgi:cytoskeleton protein RodZ